MAREDLGAWGTDARATAAAPAASLLRPCSTSAGFTATPDPPLRMDMQRLKQQLAAAGYTIVADARIILIVRHPTGPFGVVESSVYDNGKVLLKTADRPAAEAAYDHLAPIVASCQR